MLWTFKYPLERLLRSDNNGCCGPSKPAAQSGLTSFTACEVGSHQFHQLHGLDTLAILILHAFLFCFILFPPSGHRSPSRDSPKEAQASPSISHTSSFLSSSLPSVRPPQLREGFSGRPPLAPQPYRCIGEPLRFARPSACSVRGPRPWAHGRGHLGFLSA